MELEIPKQELNHSRPIVGHANFTYLESNSGDCMLDKTIVDKKFELWDYVLKNNLLQSEDKILRAKAWSLMKDKTILAYSSFRMNNKPFKARWMQDIILNDDSSKVLFCACNQFLGKSTTLDVDAATEFMLDHDKGWVGLLVSNSLEQSKHRMDSIKALLKSANITYQVEDTEQTKTGKVDNATRVSLTFFDDKGKPMYKNLLICCPHTSSALGYPANNIWLDEVDFWEDVKGGAEHFMNQVLIPRTFETEGKIKAYSNPNGKGNLMNILWNQVDEEGNPVWHRYHFNYWDGAKASQSHFNKVKRGFNKFQVESTLLALFSDSEGSLLTWDEVHNMVDTELFDVSGLGRETAWFLDVGVVHDQSVLAGCYIEPNPDSEEMPLLRVFYIHKFPVGYPISRVIGAGIKEDDGWADYADENPSVKDTLNKYAYSYMGKKEQPLFAYDATRDEGISPLLNTVGIDCNEVTFSGKLKWHMYERLQTYAQQGYITRAEDRDNNTINNKDASYQLTKLVVKKTQNKSYRTVHHENEDDFDDCADCIAALTYLHTHPDTRSLSYDIINENGSVKEEVEEEIKKQQERMKYLPEDVKKQLEGQYIPSFMSTDELLGWIEQKQKNYR
jgi:hypothetical protein